MFVTKKHHEAVKARALELTARAQRALLKEEDRCAELHNEVCVLRAQVLRANNVIRDMNIAEAARRSFDAAVRSSLDAMARRTAQKDATFMERYGQGAAKITCMPYVTQEMWEEAQRMLAEVSKPMTYKGQRKAGWMNGAGSTKP